MKLASYKDGSRDGQLVVVSRDLGLAHYASATATRLQQVLDDWNYLAPQLEDLYATLNSGKARHAFAFDPRLCMAPMPRAYQWVEAQAGEQLQRGCSAALLGPCDDVRLGRAGDEAGAAAEIDCSALLVAATADLPQGAADEQALESVRLLMLAAAWSWPAAGGAGPDPWSTRPATSFAPLAVTPDELGPDWQQGRLQAQLQVWRNGQAMGDCDTAAAMVQPLGSLVAGLARGRPLRAGGLVACGLRGAPQPAALRAGERVRLELKGRDAQSLCGAIEPQVAALQA